MATNNAINATNVNHNILVGTGSAYTSVAPSSTSGVPLISQGASSDPTYGTTVVAGGGTGQTSLTAHSVLVGNTTSAVTMLSVGADHSILMGNTGADPAFTTSGTPYVSGISFDSGSNTLSTYTVGTYTPTITGESSAGTTTYSVQQGYYTRIGNFVYLDSRVNFTAASGTGNALLGGLPFTIKNQTQGDWMGVLATESCTWPASKTAIYDDYLINTTTARMSALQTGTGSAGIQMANTSWNTYHSAGYQI